MDGKSKKDEKRRNQPKSITDKNSWQPRCMMEATCVKVVSSYRSQDSQNGHVLVLRAHIDEGLQCSALCTQSSTLQCSYGEVFIARLFQLRMVRCTDYVTELISLSTYSFTNETTPGNKTVNTYLILDFK